MRSVLIVAAEAVPFIKTGGLGDVAGSLPKELKKQGTDARIVLPKYHDIPKYWQEKMTFLGHITVPLGWRRQYCGLFMLEEAQITYYFLDNEYYFKRRGIYGFGDDAERFAFFCRAVLEVLPKLSFKPDILHCHDWHTGVVPVLLKAHYQQQPEYEHLKTVLTIHNICYQGVFEKNLLADLLDLDKTQYLDHPDLNFYGNTNFLKAGIAFADLLTTVSPSYLEEIVTGRGGLALGELLSSRRQELHGIVNGIDYEMYNPATDKAIDVQYTTQSPEHKITNKRNLQQKLGLIVDSDIPLIGMVSRLVGEKGFELVAAGIERLLGLGVELVILGTGEERYENFFRSTADHYPKQLSANIYFDNVLAHQIYAASDIYLMPSLNEPCGLSQLIALRYGTIPIVRETGGLKDTITPYNEYTGEGNGLSFTSYTSEAMLKAINQALSLRRERTVWLEMVESAMETDNSWGRSANQYLKVYDRLL
ncbi:MAG: glgA 3 [Firmicutes bacterium]|nr:glgA 3 [Bacillota bacterium]